MTRRRVRDERPFIVRRCAPALLLPMMFLGLSPQSRAQIDLGPITVGAGLQTSYEHSVPNGGSSADTFSLDHARIYINGPVYEDIKFMFNTDYDSTTNKIGVLDAVAQIRVSTSVQYLGRPLPAAERPRKSLRPILCDTSGRCSRTVSRMGIPSVFQGRDNGVVYWGDFAKKIKVSAGAFRWKVRRRQTQVIGAARVQIDFWDPEGGYYLNGTYYGDKNLLAIGGATQVQDGHTATTVDFLLEKKVLNGGAFTIESEVLELQRLGGYDAAYRQEPGRIRTGQLPFSQGSSDRQVQGQIRDPRQIREGGLHSRGGAEPRPEDHRNQFQLRHQAVQCPRHVLLRGHNYNRSCPIPGWRGSVFRYRSRRIVLNFTMKESI